jgi:hypothetical protein
MAYKRWYQRLAEMDSAEERDEFLQGVFFSTKPSKSKPFTVGLVTGYLGAKILSKDPRK